MYTYTSKCTTCNKPIMVKHANPPELIEERFAWEVTIHVMCGCTPESYATFHLPETE